MRPEPARPSPAEQRRSCRRADRLDVVAVEFDAFLHQFVDDRRLELPAVIADVGPAEIVGDDEEDVGFLGGGEVGRERQEQEDNEGSVHALKDGGSGGMLSE